MSSVGAKILCFGEMPFSYSCAVASFKPGPAHLHNSLREALEAAFLMDDAAYVSLTDTCWQARI